MPACSSPVPLLSVPVRPPKGQTRTEPHVLFKPKLLGTPELFQPDSEAQPHGPPLLGCAVFKCPGCALPALQSTPQTEPPGASEQQPGSPPPPLLLLPPQGASLWLLLLSGSWELGKTESRRREKTERGVVVERPRQQCGGGVPGVELMSTGQVSPQPQLPVTALRSLADKTLAG